MEIMGATQTDYSIGQERSYEYEINLDAPGNSDWIKERHLLKIIPHSRHWTIITSLS